MSLTMVRGTAEQAVVASEVLVPPGSSTVDYESQEAAENSKYQVLWSNTMDKGSYKNPSTYEKVEVLLLCWEDNSDDLTTKHEVHQLSQVFRQRFHYNTHTEYLENKPQKKLQVQVNAKVANFVESRDGPRTLLIVYYAGHGRPGSYYSALELHGQISENDPRDEAKQRVDTIVWNNAEDLLKHAEADVLEIFDCCYAGTLCLARGEQRSFEYLAATGAMSGTPVPGKTSFTSALIHALEYLIEEKPEGRFTTDEILRAIRSYKEFPADQTPILSDREHNNAQGRIMLHPLQVEGSKINMPLKGPEAMVPAERQTMTLHFDFGEKPSMTNVERLGCELNKIFERNTLGVNGVRWGGLRTKQSMVAQVVSTLKDRVRRSSIRRERASISIERSEEWQAQDTPGLPTPSSTGQHSPRIPEFASQTNRTSDPSLLSPTSPSKWSRSTPPHSQAREKKRRVSVSE